MDRDTLWGHVHQQRRALADLLAGLSPEQWEHPSACAGWTVRDVAAHVISTPQMGWGDVLRLGPSMLRGFNHAVFADVKRRGRAEPEQILADFATYDGSRHHVPVTTAVEPLIDAIVHAQDVARPLGLTLEADPVASAYAADRARLLSPLSGSLGVVRGVRMVATDVDWARGRGPVVEAPALELLLVCTGRTSPAVSLPGRGADATARDPRTGW